MYKAYLRTIRLNRIRLEMTPLEKESKGNTYSRKVGRK